MTFVRTLWFMLALVGAGPAGGGAAGAEERLAIKGYDPVAYFTLGKATPGDPRYEYAWDGLVYRFASAEHRDLFKGDPERYAPQYGNLCTAALSRGFRVISDPLNWTIQNGRLHLFGKPVGPEIMARDAVAMKARADGNFARHAELPWEGGAAN